MRLDPTDGIAVLEAGPWAAEKHRLLGDYIRSTWGARRKFDHRPAYVDIFSGPGRVLIEETGEIADGSPLVAWRAASESAWPFRDMFIADANPDYCEAVKRRLEARGAPAAVRCAQAVEAANWVASNLHRRSLHLAFIDPYNLGGLPWRSIEPLIAHGHIDLIVHFSQSDLTRNLDRYFKQRPSPLDDFAPGWRDHVDRRDPVQMRGRFFEYWLGLFRGYQVADAVPLFANSKNAPLYRLVLLSRHPLAKKIWDSVADRAPQRELF